MSDPLLHTDSMSSYAYSVFSEPSKPNKQLLLHPELSLENETDESYSIAESDFKRAKLEDNGGSYEVLERFKKGCDCAESNCFSELDADAVQNHRFNIAELSKGEHEMYLMGLIHASLQNPTLTHRKKERQRLKSIYRFFGSEICLDTFLFVQNTSLHQIKSLRKHLSLYGVSPRVHGNAGKKPHNTFSLSNYQEVNHFIKTYLEHHEIPNLSSSNNGSYIHLPSEFNTKRIHSDYVEHFSSHEDKIMSYTTFRRFLNEQFPKIKYEKEDGKANIEEHNNI
ncbi:uncharacterized protein [Lepeophtheirus salmonis]|uniref:uncharacterized protein n=1 Tax=Lepeophtheirus salmonis TaxID=72036 RepID=UPI001AE5A542|nr:uncharacterized protein LOC121115649 [Lepeophtheirus salmonis]